VLARLRAMPMQTYTMIAGDPSIRHLGPMAQDFYAAFGLGENDRTISTIDLDGVSLASIQALDGFVQQQDAQLQRQDARIASLAQQRDALQARLDTMDARLAVLEQAGSGPLAPSGPAQPGPVAPAAGATLLALGALAVLPRARRLFGNRVDGAVHVAPARSPSHPTRPAVPGVAVSDTPTGRSASVGSERSVATPSKRRGQKRAGGSKRRRGR